MRSPLCSNAYTFRSDTYTKGNTSPNYRALYRNLGSFLAVQIDIVDKPANLIRLAPSNQGIRLTMGAPEGSERQTPYR